MTFPFNKHDAYRLVIRAASHCVEGYKISEADMEAARILIRLSQSLPIYGPRS